MNMDKEDEIKKLKFEKKIILFNLALVFIFAVITIFFLFIYGIKEEWKRGYEEAVEDFYNEKLKCERIEESKVKYIWSEEK